MAAYQLSGYLPAVWPAIRSFMVGIMPLAGIETPSDTVRLLSCPRGVMSEPNHKTASNLAGAYSPEGANDASQVPSADMATIEAWLKEHKISEVECLVPDMTGNARGKFIPAHQFTANREIKLPESIMVQTVTGEYTDDHWDFVEPTDTDMPYCLASSVSSCRYASVWLR